MDQVIRNLKDKEIIYGQRVAALKNYILKKYPVMDDLQRAEIFADAVHKILDDHVREFSRPYQRRIKHDLLIHTAKKDNFEVVAYDIMRTCVALDVDDEAFFDDLTSWLNHEQDEPVYRHQLHEITQVVLEDLAEDEVTVSDAIIDENRAAVEAADGERRRKLLAQLDAAFDYDPRQSGPEDHTTPELYAEGEINTAFEAEMRKENLGAMFTLEGIDPENHFGEDTGPVYDHLAEGANIIETEAMIPETGKEEQAPGDRQVIKVEHDIEPYFSETPEIWETEVAKPSLLEGMKEGIVGKNIKMIGVLSGLILLVIAIIIVLIWYVTQEPALDESVLDMTTSVTQEGVGGSLSPIILDPDPKETDSEEPIADRSKSSAHLEDSIRYKDIDREALRTWLTRNDSMVGDEPYFTTIIEVAEDYGVNPLLMFAITGQEQGFVPKDSEFANRMINNPFNVYGSWETYNTDLKESAQIAARTILTASEDKPEGVDPVEWINQTYAEDENWSDGVNLILEQFEIEAGR